MQFENHADIGLSYTSCSKTPIFFTATWSLHCQCVCNIIPSRAVKHHSQQSGCRHGRIQTGGTEGTCPLQTIMADSSGQIGSVLLALPVRFQNVLNMHEIAQNCVCNAKKIISEPAGWAYDALPNLQSAGEGVNILPRLLDLASRLKSSVPLPKQFPVSEWAECESKNPPWGFPTFFSKTVGI